jgi:hypothetical protein
MPGPLDREIYELVHQWALSKGYVRVEHPYEEVVTGEFVE